jgi:hypothetical protein
LFAVIATCCGCGKGDSGDCLQRLLVREKGKGKRARDVIVDEVARSMSIWTRFRWGRAREGELDGKVWESLRVRKRGIRSAEQPS